MGLFSCCDKKENDKEPAPKSLKDRSCTDCFCLLFFTVFVAALIAILVFAIFTGDLNSLKYGADYLGNRCGVGDFADRPKAFYPRLALDLFEQKQYVATQQYWKLNFYTLCLAACPTQFSISSPTLINDYGYDASAPKTWISAVPTVDIFNRCIPRQEAATTSESLCAYPDCNAAAVVAAGGTCSAQGDNSWAVCPAGTNTDDCTTQQTTCVVKVKRSSETSYSVSTADDNGQGALATLSRYVGGLFEIMSALQESLVMVLIGGLVAPIALAFVYLLLLRYFARTIVYGMLIALLVFMVFIVIFCYAKSGMSLGGVSAASLLGSGLVNQTGLMSDPTIAGLASVSEENKTIYTIGFWVLAVLTVITFMGLAVARKKITTCVEIVKASTSAFGDMPTLMIFPLWSTIAQAAVVGWTFFGLVLLSTTQPESLASALSRASDSANSTAATDLISVFRSLKTDDITLGLTLGQVYGGLVLFQWVQMVAWCTMSGAVCWWYFFKNDEKESTKVPILSSLWRTLRYHIGSMAFAAFIIAAIQLIRLIFLYIQKQLKPKNLLLKLAMKCFAICLWCLEKTLKYISYYGIVFVALKGNSFCRGCFNTFKFIAKNLSQASVNGLVTKLLSLLSLLTIPLGCAIIFYTYLNEVQKMTNPMYPAVVIFLMAMVVTSSCMVVFECTITTIFVCCFEDSDQYGGKFMPDGIRKAFDMPPKKDGAAKEECAPAAGGEATQKI